MKEWTCATCGHAWTTLDYGPGAERCEKCLLTIRADVPEPFNRGKILLQRGAWIQCEVRADHGEGREKRARRIYVNDQGFPEALFLLLRDLEQPSTLPVWEPGEFIAGYRNPATHPGD